jgi:hypothetical protein
MHVSSLSRWPHRWRNAAKLMICKLVLIAAPLAVGWSVVGILGEQSGVVLPANAETPAERCAKRGMVLVGRSCETPTKSAESPAERCAKRGMVLVGRSCETPKKKAESPAERCAKRGMVLVGRSCETPKKKKAETPQQRCAKQNKKC